MLPKSTLREALPQMEKLKKYYGVQGYINKTGRISHQCDCSQHMLPTL